MNDMPVVVKALFVKDYIIEVSFSNGVSSKIDFSPWLNGPVFEPVKKSDYFQKFFVDGWTVAWPNGADVAPETLYEAANKKSVA